MSNGNHIDPGGRATIVSLNDSWLKHLHALLSNAGESSPVVRSQLVTAISIERGNLVRQRLADLLVDTNAKLDSLREINKTLDALDDRLEKSNNDVVITVGEIVDKLDDLFELHRTALGAMVEDEALPPEPEKPAIDTLLPRPATEPAGNVVTLDEAVAEGAKIAAETDVKAAAAGAAIVEAIRTGATAEEIVCAC